MKAALVGVTGSAISLLVLGGMQPISFMGMMYMPKAAIHGLILTASSVAAGYAVPQLVPFVSAGSPQLRRFETIILEPMVLGGIFLAVETIVAPAGLAGGPGGVFANVATGAGASIAASYLAEGMGWVDTVMG